ncbi:MAG: response regulator [Candidatus Sulfotelmatobacter sp.]
METTLIRVLVVEDYEPFRRFLRSTLGKRPGLRLVGEASDGLEAVQKAEKLQPDLIVLDIGLPTFNGIEAARRIREISPQTKILFVSQESSAEVVQEALNTGAHGFVVKIDMGSDLLKGVSAVLRGDQFVSKRVSGEDFVVGSHAGVSEDPQNDSSCEKRQQDMEIPRSHEVEFYSDDAAFVVGFTRFIEAALEAGNAVIVIATESHPDSLLLRLQEHGVDVAAAIEQGRYVSLDVADTLSTFMVNDLPDPARCLKVAGDLVMEAAKAAQGEPLRVVVCGECAPTLWKQGKADAAVQVEHLWDEIARKHGVKVLCGYVLNSSQCERGSHIYEKICAEHSAVYSR